MVPEARGRLVLLCFLVKEVTKKYCYENLRNGGESCRAVALLGSLMIPLKHPEKYIRRDQ